MFREMIDKATRWTGFEAGKDNWRPANAEIFEATNRAIGRNKERRAGSIMAFRTTGNMWSKMGKDRVEEEGRKEGLYESQRNEEQDKETEPAESWAPEENTREKSSGNCRSDCHHVPMFSSDLGGLTFLEIADCGLRLSGPKSVLKN